MLASVARKNDLDKRKKQSLVGAHCEVYIHTMQGLAGHSTISVCHRVPLHSYLCNELQSSIEKNDTTMRKAIPADMCVALTLWFLVTGADYCTIGHLFGISKSGM